MNSQYQNKNFLSWKQKVSQYSPHGNFTPSGSFSGTPLLPTATATGNPLVFNIAGELTDDIPPILYNWFINGVLITSTLTNLWTTPALSNGNNFITYTITSQNVTSSFSNSLNIPITLIPPVPSSFTAIGDLSNFAFTLSCASITGFGIITYNYFIDGLLQLSSLSNSQLIGPITYGNHTAQMSATNSNGTSALTSVANIFAGTLPPAPSSFTITPDVIGTSFTFTCAAITGFGTITYKYYIDGVFNTSNSSNTQLIGPLAQGNYTGNMIAENSLGESLSSVIINFSSNADISSPNFTFNDPQASSIGALTVLNTVITYSAPSPSQPRITTVTNQTLATGGKMKFRLTATGSDISQVALVITSLNVDVTNASVSTLFTANAYFGYFLNGGLIYGSLSSANLVGAPLAINLNDTISIQRTGNAIAFLKNGIIMFTMTSATFSASVFVGLYKSTTPTTYVPNIALTIL